ncbi:MAG: MFS transporter [Propionibacteriaceae bacterium]|nr:MFS transporter [Propionibacteriaceae bacterium]
MNGTEQLADPKRWRALVVCLLGGFVTMLFLSMVSVSLPSIQSSLDASPAAIQVVVAGYTLAFALCVVPAGRLGDVRGRRTLFVIGMTGFGVVTALAGMSNSATMLACLRVLQGGFAGLVNPQTMGIIQQVFRGPERGKAFGFIGGVIGVATALGPLCGGAAIAIWGQSDGWRWAFWVVLPLVALTAILACFWLPAKTEQSASQRLDPVGLLLIGVGTVAIMTPFVLAEAAGATPWWLIGVGAVFLVFFGLWEMRYQRKYQAAVLDPELLHNVGFRFGVGVGMAYFAGFTSVFLVVTMMLQEGLGYSALMAGLVGACFAVGSGIAAPIAGRLVARHGRAIVVAALTVMVVGLIIVDCVMRWAPTHLYGVWIGLALFLAGLGSGATISPNQTLTLMSVPPRIGGVAGGALQIGQQLGSAVGLSVVLAGYFVALPSSGPRGGAAHTLLFSVGLVILALVIAFIDWRRRSGDESGPIQGKSREEGAGPGGTVVP